MRETDQASVLLGVWEMFSGHPLLKEAYYNYDKLYETYWITILGFWTRSRFAGAWSPVLVANATAAIAFWSTSMAAILVLAKGRSKPSLLAVVCYFSTPAILINAVYLNPAIVSAGFLLLSGALLSTSRTTLCRWVSALSFFVAVGARADAMLLAPLFIWLQTPASATLHHRNTKRTIFLLGGAAALATVLGMVVYSGKRLYLDPGYLGFKVFLGYVVIGLGPSLFLLILICSVLLYRAVKCARADRAIFYSSGAIVLLVPLGYYSLQLWSPRYLVTTAVAVFVFSTSRRGQTLLNPRFVHPLGHSVRIVIAASAILLLFVGIKVPSLRHFGLTFSQPTVFPTADGVHPIGAYASFLLNIRNVDEREIDHNQLVWKAAEHTNYVPGPDRFVHVLETPMRAYLQLGAALKGLPSRIEAVRKNYDLRGQIYADSRTFMRLNSDQVDGGLFRLLARPARIVSPEYGGIAVLQFAPHGNPSWGLPVRVLDNLFTGNEYRVYTPSAFGRYTGTEERPLAILADRQFQIAVNGRKIDSEVDGRSGLFYLRGDTQEFATCRSLSNESGHFVIAVQVLPTWMSVHNR